VVSFRLTGYVLVDVSEVGCPSSAYPTPFPSLLPLDELLRVLLKRRGIWVGIVCLLLFELAFLLVGRKAGLADFPSFFCFGSCTGWYRVSWAPALMPVFWLRVLCGLSSG
ncbi:hypothetical protein A2U01_0037146, partial [Trifolium medium]|nr:hypothetical protein [Trifolium medium]